MEEILEDKLKQAALRWSSVISAQNIAQAVKWGALLEPFRLQVTGRYDILAYENGTTLIDSATGQVSGVAPHEPLAWTAKGILFKGRYQDEIFFKTPQATAIDMVCFVDASLSGQTSVIEKVVSGMLKDYSVYVSPSGKFAIHERDKFNGDAVMVEEGTIRCKHKETISHVYWVNDDRVLFTRRRHNASPSMILYDTASRKESELGHGYILGMSGDSLVYLVNETIFVGERVLAKGNLPVLSPNGQLVVCNQGGQVVVMDCLGNQRFALPGMYEYRSEVLWSPDSTRLAYQMLSDKPQTAVINVVSGELVPVQVGSLSFVGWKCV